MADVSDAALQKNISRYITLWRREKANVSGEGLRAFGLQHGPAFGRILEAVLAAKLDGLATSPEQQLELAHSLAQQEMEAALAAPKAKNSASGKEVQASRNSSLAQRL